MVKLIFAGVGLIASLIVFMSHAHAATYTDSGANKTVYFDKSGKKLSPLEANRLGESGDTVLACKVQDYVCNERTGKCQLKNAR